ncbi:MAG: hypothetical protein RLZZ516_1645 [Cyanobacteriota bacterium]
MAEETPTRTSVQDPALGTIIVESIGKPSSSELNQAISDPIEAISYASTYQFFNENNLLTPFDASSMGASNGVDLYRLTYTTRIPGSGREESVSGLLAIPQLDPARALPMVSWQHGTLFEPDEAPSCIYKEQVLNRSPAGLPRSIETLCNVVALAGNGYIVAAADYIGNGVSKPGQAFAREDITVQTIQDMLAASEAVLQHLSRRRRELFLHGWSQGGLNTLWLAHALQDNPHWSPTRVSTVSAPSNLPRICRYWLNNFGGDPTWVTPVVSILLGAYETYGGIENLISQAIQEKYQDCCRAIYAKEYDWNLVNWMHSNPIRFPQDPAMPGIRLPAKGRDMIKEAFLDAYNQDTGEFYTQISNNTALQGPFTMPCRFYGGLSDTVVPPWSSITYLEEQQRLHGQPLGTGILVDQLIPMTADRVGKAGATHRSTFLASLFDPGLSVRRWFDEALEPSPSA